MHSFSMFVLIFDAFIIVLVHDEVSSWEEGEENNNHKKGVHFLNLLRVDFQYALFAGFKGIQF